ncbi:MAG TPA: methyltransferase domain-containing protein [Bryobacteraceae bacterium]|nr:methyltransferase domain-containing protein [Bryobacteraceae bacterium]HPT28660.1 methyltransferase domain-containing protein [Bryobacteraceae bacterium]
MRDSLRDSTLRSEDGLPITKLVLESHFGALPRPLGALYRAAMAALAAEPLAGKHVLDYGSDSAKFGIWLAVENAEVHLLDPSPANLELGLKQAEASGVARRVKAIHLTDPANLDMFAADAFDLVFSRTPLAELAALPGSLDEIARIMKPEARLVLAQIEPPARAARTALDHLFAEVGIRKISARQGLLARMLPGEVPALITARK